MKNLLLVLAIALTVFSCTPEEQAQCGTLTGWNESGLGELKKHVVYIDNNSQVVSSLVYAEVKYNGNIGDYVCLEDFVDADCFCGLVVSKEISPAFENHNITVRNECSGNEATTSVGPIIFMETIVGSYYCTNQ